MPDTPELIAAAGSPHAPAPPVLIGTPAVLPALKMAQGGFLPGAGQVAITYPLGKEPTLPLAVTNGTLENALVTTLPTGQKQVTGKATFADGTAVMLFTDTALGLSTRSYWTFQRISRRPRGYPYGIAASLAGVAVNGGLFVTAPGVAVAPSFRFNNQGMTIGGPITTYEVRDSVTLAVVASGPVPLPDTGTIYSTLTLPPLSQYGAYSLWLFGNTNDPVNGKVLMSTVFSIGPPVPAGCNIQDPPLKGVNVNAPDYYTEAPQMRFGATGCFRLFVKDASKAESDFARMDATLVSQKAAYVLGRDGQALADPVRGREQMINFPGLTNTPEQMAGVTRTVARYYAQGVRWFEGANEPGVSNTSVPAVGAAYVPVMKAFHDAVKAGHPDAQVLGPAGVNPLAGLDAFLKAGGGDTFDGFSFHAYNEINGDYDMGERVLSKAGAILAKYGQASKPRWMTEQGDAIAFGAVVSTTTAIAGMLARIMVQERWAVPQEHCPYWQIKAGDDNFPCELLNFDGSYNPTALVLWRWAIELWQRPFASAYSFGAAGDGLWYGNRFDPKTPGGQLDAAAMSTSVFAGKNTKGEVLKLRVSGSAWNSSVVTADAFGNETVCQVPGGILTLPPSDAFVRYVRHPSSWTLTPISNDYGDNLAQLPGLTVTTASNQSMAGLLVNGKTKNPFSTFLAAADGGGKCFGSSSNWSTVSMQGINGYSIKNDTHLPYDIVLTLPTAQPVRRVILSTPPPRIVLSSLLKFQIWTRAEGGAWRLQGTWSQPALGLQQLMDSGTYASGYVQRMDGVSTFNCWLPAYVPNVKDVKITVVDCTYGGAVNDIARQCGGYGGYRNITIGNIWLYAK